MSPVLSCVFYFLGCHEGREDRLKMAHAVATTALPFLSCVTKGKPWRPLFLCSLVLVWARPGHASWQLCCVPLSFPLWTKELSGRARETCTQGLHFDLWLFGLLFLDHLESELLHHLTWIKICLVSKAETLWQLLPENYKKLESVWAQQNEIKSNCDRENTLGRNRNFAVIMTVATVVSFSQQPFSVRRFIRWMDSHLENL